MGPGTGMTPPDWCRVCGSPLFDEVGFYTHMTCHGKNKVHEAVLKRLKARKKIMRLSISTPSGRVFDGMEQFITKKEAMK